MTTKLIVLTYEDFLEQSDDSLRGTLDTLVDVDLRIGHRTVLMRSIDGATQLTLKIPLGHPVTMQVFRFLCVCAVMSIERFYGVTMIDRSTGDIRITRILKAHDRPQMVEAIRNLLRQACPWDELFATHLLH